MPLLQGSVVDADEALVICTLLAKDGTWASTQINLLNACLIAGVSRFAPAEFGCGPLAARNISMLAPQIPVIDACRAAKLQYPDFEFAAFHLGIFMNYLGYGSINEEDALHGFNDNWEDSWWHINTMRAEIPLTRKGDIPSVTMTEIRDVGKFVAAACQLSQGKWQENFSMAGETIKMNDVCTIAENVRGQKMQIEYRPYEKTVELKEKEEHFYRKFWYELEEMNARNAVGEGIVEPILNELCPDVKPITVEGYINKYWS